MFIGICMIGQGRAGRRRAALLVWVWNGIYEYAMICYAMQCNAMLRYLMSYERIPYDDMMTRHDDTDTDIDTDTDMCLPGTQLQTLGIGPRRRIAYTCISASVHQCISVSVYQCISVSVYQCISASVYQCISVSVYQLIGRFVDLGCRWKI